MDDALLLLLTPRSLAYVLSGTLLGIIVGAMPGLTGAMLIALALPMTYTLAPESAMTWLVSMYVGSISGGLISATLLRMPGTPASIMTTLDGYPLARRGQPGRALGLGIVSSFVGGVVSWVFLVTVSKPIALISASFGPFELFALVLMALVLIASLGGNSILKSLLAGFFGILVSMPGISAATGQTRLTFGITELNDGFKLLPVLIGLFAVSQVVRDAATRKGKVESIELANQSLKLPISDLLRHGWGSLRASIIGTWIGILPGIGANIGSVAAYSVAKTFSKRPQEFGTGSEEGIVSSESANNATVGGALIPLVAMGIPGSVIDAILLGALIVHGLQPGPRLFQDNPEIVYTIMGCYLISNIFMVALMLLAVRWIARLSSIPKGYLIPVVLAFCVLGSFALSNRFFDVWVMIAFGILGLIMERWRIPLAPFVIGFVLGPIAEENLSAGLMSSNGSFLPIITRPISAAFTLLAVSMLVYSVLQARDKPATDDADDSS